MTLLHYIYPRIMPEVNVSATVETSATVGEMSAIVWECPRQWGKCLQHGLGHGLGNLRVEIVIHNSAYIT